MFNGAITTLNVQKTKELIIDFRKTKSVPDPVTIKGQIVERVETYKYLGIVIDNQLNWKEHAKQVSTKANTRLYFLRKLRSFDVSADILNLFYSSVVRSVMSFGLVCWGGNLVKDDVNKMDKLIKRASSIVGRKQDDFMRLYDRRVVVKLSDILSDDTHPLRGEFDSRHIERSGRYRLPAIATQRYKNSFIPRAIAAFNDRYVRP